MKGPSFRKYTMKILTISGDSAKRYISYHQIVTGKIKVGSRSPEAPPPPIDPAMLAPKNAQWHMNSEK